MKPQKPQKKKITISAQKSKPKKADDFTVNTATGKRTLSGAEASRRTELNRKGLKSGAAGTRNINDYGVYGTEAIKGSKLPVSTGGYRNVSNYEFRQTYRPAGTRTKKERGR